MIGVHVERGEADHILLGPVGIGNVLAGVRMREDRLAIVDGARIVRLFAKPRRRDGLRHFPHAREAEARIEREHADGRGRAGARQTADENRAFHGLCLDFGMRRVPLLDAQPVGEILDDAIHGRRHDVRLERQPRESSERAFEALLETRRAEIIRSRQRYCPRLGLGGRHSRHTPLPAGSNGRHHGKD